jgi:hypothetical protein
VADLLLLLLLLLPLPLLQQAPLLLKLWGGCGGAAKEGGLGQGVWWRKQGGYWYTLHSWKGPLSQLPLSRDESCCPLLAPADFVSGAIEQAVRLLLPSGGLAEGGGKRSKKQLLQRQAHARTRSCRAAFGPGRVDSEMKLLPVRCVAIATE